MSATALAAVLLIPLGLLALGLNHLLARVGLIELALSQGRPQQTRPSNTSEQPAAFDPIGAGKALPADSLNLFVSATCVSCARLVDELAEPDLAHPFELDLYFSERRSPLARRGRIHEDQAELFAELAVPVTPYAVLTRDGAVVTHGGVADLPALAALLGWKPQATALGRPA